MRGDVTVCMAWAVSQGPRRVRVGAIPIICRASLRFTVRAATGWRVTTFRSRSLTNVYVSEEEGRSRHAKETHGRGRVGVGGGTFVATLRQAMVETVSYRREGLRHVALLSTTVTMGREITRGDETGQGTGPIRVKTLGRRSTTIT